MKHPLTAPLPPVLRPSGRYAFASPTERSAPPLRSGATLAFGCGTPLVPRVAPPPSRPTVRCGTPLALALLVGKGWASTPPHSRLPVRCGMIFRFAKIPPPLSSRLQGEYGYLSS